MKKLLLLFVMLNLFQHLASAQNQLPPNKGGKGGVTDSLLAVLKTAKEDTLKVNLLNTLSKELMNTGDYEPAITYANDAKALAGKVNFKKGIANSYNNIGIIYHYQGNYPEALKNYLASLKIREEIGDKKGIAYSYNNIGGLYYYQGNYPESLKNYLASLKIREEIRDKAGIAMSYNNIGLIYHDQGNYPEALKNYLASLKIDEELGDKAGIAASYNNIGLIYDHQGNYPEALKNHFASLKIKEKIEDKAGIASSYNNIGIIYKKQGNYPEALKNHFASLKIREEIDNKAGIATSFVNIGLLFTLMNKATEGKAWLQKSLRLSREIRSLEHIKHSYGGLAKADSALGNYKAAFEHYKMYITYRDSLFNKENTKKIVQEQMQYEYEKKEAVARAEQGKKEALHKAELEQQTMQRNGFIGGFALMLALAGVSYRSYRNKRKAHAVITEQKTIVEEKNKDILSSIKYAKRIQEAILPPAALVKQALPESFVLYQPKDIVSGDFYWLEQKGSKVLLAAVDCTGHGVPGAFMTIVGHNGLSSAANEHNLTKPADILNYLNKTVHDTLRQTYEESSVKDGMDISLCAFDFAGNKVEYAGANNPLWDHKRGRINYNKNRPAPDRNFYGRRIKAIHQS